MRSFRLSDSFKFAPNVVCQVMGNYKCYGMIAVHSIATSTMHVHVAMLCISDSNINEFSAKLERFKVEAKIQRWDIRGNQRTECSSESTATAKAGR